MESFFYESNLDFSQYSRQVVLPEIGIEGQNKIKNSSIAIIGMGGLGCPAAQSLVASGVGHLKIIDNDKIEITNLHRQPLYDQNDLGSLKVAVSKKKLEKLNENIVIETFNCFFDKSNAIDILKNTDIVIDATDNYRSRMIIDNRFKKIRDTNDLWGCIGLKVMFQYLIIMKVQALRKFFPIQMRKKMTVTQQGF